MERQTETFETDGHAFVVRTYATAREANTIQQAYFKGTKLEVVGDQPKISEFNPAVQFEVQQEMVRQMVVLMDGRADDIVERCLDLPNDTYTALVEYLDGLISKKKS